MPSTNTRFAIPGRSMTRVVTRFCLAFLVMFPHAAAAQEPLSFFKNYFVTGDYSVRGVSLWRRGINGRATAVIPPLGGVDGVPPTADILAAFLYVQTAEKVRGSGIHNARFTGHDLGPFTAAGSSEPGSGTFAKALVNWDAAPTPCWSVAYPGGRKLMTYRVDVLRFLPIDPNTGKQSLITPHQIVVPDAGLLFGDDDEGRTESGNSALPRAIGASLVVVYRKAGMPYAGIVINDGAFTKRAFSTMSQPISGFYEASAAPSAKMTHIVGDGRPFFSERVYAGGKLLATNPFVSALGAKWDNTTFVVPPSALVAPGLPVGSTTTVVDRHGLLSDCLSYSAIVFRTTVQDTDEDGLLDRWETESGLTDPNGFELPNLSAMGADPFHKDLFIEIGYMKTSGPVSYGPLIKEAHTHLPAAEALKMVGDAFERAPVVNPDLTTGIRVHFDVGDNHQNSEASPYIIAADLARGGEYLDEMRTVCTRDPLDPRICQFSGFPDPKTGHPGTVGWKTGFRFIRDSLLRPATSPEARQAQEELCAVPDNERLDVCQRRFDANRQNMFYYLFSAHAVGLPRNPCLKPNGTADAVCRTQQPDFHIPRTISGIADVPGGDMLLTLGAFDDSDGKPVGTPFMQGATIMHEWGHTFELKHGGPANPMVNGVVVPQIPRAPNCQPQYLSVMNYMYQLRGLLDDGGSPHFNYAGQASDPINEVFIPAGLSALPYRLGWYAPKRGSYLEESGRAATKHCDGSDLTPAEIADLDDPVGGMVRVNGISIADLSKGIDWNANGQLDEGPQDINFSGAKTLLKGGADDWANLRLNELGGRRNVGGLYRDKLGRLAVGPMSLNVGNGDIGNGDIGNGDIGNGDIGNGDIGNGDIGNGDIGNGDIGNGDIGNGDIGRGDMGRGLFGGGDLDVGGASEPLGELDLETAQAVEGLTEDDPPTSPPSALTACLTSGSECTTDGGDTPVRLEWQVPHLGRPVGYSIYRFAYEGEFVAPSELPTEAIATVEASEFNTYSDDSAPAGMQLAYFVRARFAGGIVSGISNFATVTTPADAADLVISNYTPSIDPRFATAGAEVPISGWTVRNQGTGDANAPGGSFENGFYLSTDPVITATDVLLGENTNTNSVLPAGGEFVWGGPTLVIPEGTPPGNYYIGILVDRDNLVGESDEGNNYVSEPITVYELD